MRISKNNKEFDNQVSRILYFILAYFAVLYFVLAYWNGLTPDDYNFLANLKEQGGVWKATVYEYQNWSTRYTSVFLNEWFLSWDWRFMAELRNFISLGLIFTGIYLWVNKVSMNNVGKLFLTGMLTMCFFWGIQDIGDTWFWHCATFTYLWPIAFILIVTSLLLTKFSWWKYIVTGVLAIYIGGASVPIAIFFIGLLLSMFFFTKKNKRAMCFTMLLVCIACLILLMGEGNVNRSAQLPQTSIMMSFWINIKSIVKYYLFEVPLKLPFWIAAGLIFVIIPQKYEVIRLDFTQLIALGLFIVTITFFYHLPIAYGMGEIGPMRSFSIISIMHLGWFVLLGMSITERTKSSRKWISYGLLLLTTVYFSLTIQKQVEYGKALRQRVMKYQSEKKAIELSPLPNPGLYPSSEIKADSNHFTQKHVQRVFGPKQIRFKE